MSAKPDKNAIDRLIMSERPNDLHVDMTDLDDGDEPTARDEQAEAKQREAFDAIGVLN